jgi:transposase
MLMLPSALRVFVYTGPTDMRRSFDGLAAMVREIIGQDPLSGHLFVFTNRPRNRVKLLVWDRTGYLLFYKRLEEGVFTFRGADGQICLEMTATDLALVLEGIDLSSARRQKRFRLRPTT